MLDSKSLGRLVKDYATYVDESAYHALFARLRKEAPLAWAEPEGCRPFWVVTKHADIRDVELQATQFVNAARTFLLTVEEERQLPRVCGLIKHSFESRQDGIGAPVLLKGNCSA